MRRKQGFVNDVIIDPKDINSKQIHEVETYIEPVSNELRALSEAKYSRRCRVKPIHIEAMRTLIMAGWSIKQVSIAMGFSIMAINYYLHHVKKPRPKKSRKIPDYWAERERAAKICRRELKEEGLI